MPIVTEAECTGCKTRTPATKTTPPPNWLHLRKPDHTAELGDFCSWGCLSAYARRKASEQFLSETLQEAQLPTPPQITT